MVVYLWLIAELKLHLVEVGQRVLHLQSLELLLLLLLLSLLGQVCLAAGQVRVQTSQVTAMVIRVNTRSNCEPILVHFDHCVIASPPCGIKRHIPNCNTIAGIADILFSYTAFYVPCFHCNQYIYIYIYIYILFTYYWPLMRPITCNDNNISQPLFELNAMLMY